MSQLEDARSSGEREDLQLAGSTPLSPERRHIRDACLTTGDRVKYVSGLQENLAAESRVLGTKGTVGAE